MSDDPNAREEGFYWVVLGENPPEIAYREHGEWWLAGDARPWQPDAVKRAQRQAGVQAAADAGCRIRRLAPVTAPPSDPRFHLLR
jgi:hypothetical protein